MTNNSLTYEPGITLSHYDVEKYNLLIYYKNIEYSILYIINILDNNSSNNICIDNTSNNICNESNYNIIIKFKEEIIEYFLKNKTNIYDKIISLKTDINNYSFITNNFININTYNLKYNLNVENLLKQFYKIENKFK